MPQILDLNMYVTMLAVCVSCNYLRVCKNGQCASCRLRAQSYLNPYIMLPDEDLQGTYNMFDGLGDYIDGIYDPRLNAWRENPFPQLPPHHPNVGSATIDPRNYSGLSRSGSLDYNVPKKFFDEYMNRVDKKIAEEKKLKGKMDNNLISKMASNISKIARSIFFL